MEKVRGQEACAPAAGRDASRKRGFVVIRLTRLNGSELYLNADLVATVEAHHDTVVTLVDGKTYVVLETAEGVVQRITDYRAAVLASAEMQLTQPHEDPSGGQVLHLHPVHERGL
jgi:flagellar protein FlbD